MQIEEKKILKDKYQTMYNNHKNSKQVDRLANWKLDNHDEPFNMDKYKSNMEYFLDDIVDETKALEGK